MATGSSTTGVDLGLTQRIQSVGDLLNMGPNGGAHSSHAAAMGMGKEGLVVTSVSASSTNKGREGFFFLGLGGLTPLRQGQHGEGVGDSERLFTSWQHSEQITEEPKLAS